MGVAALVLGIIAIILAFFGGVGGVILGIAAVVLGVLGRRAAERDGMPQGSATAGLITGIVGIVLGAAVFGACVMCAKSCAEVARGVARLGEARVTMQQIGQLEEAYYGAERLDAEGNLLPRTFASAGAVPAKAPCQDKPVMVTPEDWKAAGWDKIHFGPAGPTMFQFEAVARGEGKNARLEVIARTDPRCDGTVADLRERYAVDGQGRPFMIQSPFGPHGGKASYRRGIRRGAAPGVGTEPGAEPPAEAEEPDDNAPPPPDRPSAPGAAKAPGASGAAKAPGASGAAKPPAPAPAAPAAPSPAE
jgi:hypothetical protein